MRNAPAGATKRRQMLPNRSRVGAGLAPAGEVSTRVCRLMSVWRSSCDLEQRDHRRRLRAVDSNFIAETDEHRASSNVAGKSAPRLTSATQCWFRGFSAAPLRCRRPAFRSRWSGPSPPSRRSGQVRCRRARRFPSAWRPRAAVLLAPRRGLRERAPRGIRQSFLPRASGSCRRRFGNCHSVMTPPSLKRSLSLTII